MSFLTKIFRRDQKVITASRELESERELFLEKSSQIANEIKASRDLRESFRYQFPIESALHPAHPSTLRKRVKAKTRK